MYREINSERQSLMSRNNLLNGTKAESITITNRNSNFIPQSESWVHDKILPKIEKVRVVLKSY